MKHHKELFEFLVKLIDIQIGKYVALAKIAIGPDASMNSRVVFDSVQELLGSARILLKDIKENQDNEMIDNSQFIEIFYQIKFYLQCECLRGAAGALLDANNLHNKLDKPLENQMVQLQKMAASARLPFSTALIPKNDTQYQCRHDSYAIAFYIVDLARNISLNPTMSLPQTLPNHVQAILRKNATTRYVEKEKEIEELHEECQNFLKQSPLQKNTSTFDTKEAQEHAVSDKNQLAQLLAEWKAIEPQNDSKTEMAGKYTLLRTHGLFMVGTVAALAVVTQLGPCLSHMLEGNHSLTPH